MLLAKEDMAKVLREIGHTLDIFGKRKTMG